MLGVSASLVSAANALAPLIWGAFYQTLGEMSPFLLGGLVLIALFVLAAQRITEQVAEATPAPDLQTASAETR